MVAKKVFALLLVACALLQVVLLLVLVVAAECRDGASFNKLPAFTLASDAAAAWRATPSGTESAHHWQPGAHRELLLVVLVGGSKGPSSESAGWRLTTLVSGYSAHGFTPAVAFVELFQAVDPSQSTTTSTTTTSHYGSTNIMMHHDTVTAHIERVVFFSRIMREYEHYQSEFVGVETLWSRVAAFDKLCERLARAMPVTNRAKGNRGKPLKGHRAIESRLSRLARLLLAAPRRANCECANRQCAHCAATVGTPFRYRLCATMSTVACICVVGVAMALAVILSPGNSATVLGGALFDIAAGAAHGAIAGVRKVARAAVHLIATPLRTHAFVVCLGVVAITLALPAIRVPAASSIALHRALRAIVDVAAGAAAHAAIAGVRKGARAALSAVHLICTLFFSMAWVVVCVGVVSATLAFPTIVTPTASSEALHCALDACFGVAAGAAHGVYAAVHKLSLCIARCNSSACRSTFGSLVSAVRVVLYALAADEAAIVMATTRRSRRPCPGRRYRYSPAANSMTYPGWRRFAALPPIAIVDGATGGTTSATTAPTVATTSADGAVASPTRGGKGRRKSRSLEPRFMRSGCASAAPTFTVFVKTTAADGSPKTIVVDVHSNDTVAHLEAAVQVCAQRLSGGVSSAAAALGAATVGGSTSRLLSLSDCGSGALFALEQPYLSPSHLAHPRDVRMQRKRNLTTPFAGRLCMASKVLRVRGARCSASAARPLLLIGDYNLTKDTTLEHFEDRLLGGALSLSDKAALNASIAVRHGVSMRIFLFMCVCVCIIDSVCMHA